MHCVHAQQFPVWSVWPLEVNSRRVAIGKGDFLSSISVSRDKSVQFGGTSRTLSCQKDDYVTDIMRSVKVS